MKQPQASWPAKPSVWADITRDPKTGHTVAKDLYKAQAFYAGLFYLLILVPTVVLLTETHLELPIEPGVVLVLLAFGLAALKVGANYLDRKTADDAGNPLAVPPPGEEPPPIMQQVPNPNEPAHPAPIPA